MKHGDTVYINNPHARWHGQSVTVRGTNRKNGYVNCEMADGMKFYFPPNELSKTDPAAVSQPPIAVRSQTEESPYDFSSSGLGIGGLSNYEAPPFVPTEAQLAAQERRERNYVLCDCGHRVPRIQRMYASLGTACPACYDRMSG